MKTEQILMFVFALVLGMLLANMLKDVCGCKVVEGQDNLGTLTIDNDHVITYTHPNGNSWTLSDNGKELLSERLAFFSVDNMLPLLLNYQNDNDNLNNYSIRTGGYKPDLIYYYNMLSDSGDGYLCGGRAQTAWGLNFNEPWPVTSCNNPPSH